MNLLKLLFLSAMAISPTAAADSFSHDGIVVTSQTSESLVHCGDYQVILENEHFPFKHELDVPDSYRIKGYFGSTATIRKEAFILPGRVAIPQPNELEEIRDLYPENRTYLPGSAVCKGSTLIVSYWSGGNCKECEAFVQFEVVDGSPTNPQKVHYGHVRKLKQ